jgi:hypothetical protein
LKTYKVKNRFQILLFQIQPLQRGLEAKASDPQRIAEYVDRYITAADISLPELMARAQSAALPPPAPPPPPAPLVTKLSIFTEGGGKGKSDADAVAEAVAAAAVNLRNLGKGRGGGKDGKYGKKDNAGVWIKVTKIPPGPDGTGGGGLKVEIVKGPPEARGDGEEGEDEEDAPPPFDAIAALELLTGTKRLARKMTGAPDNDAVENLLDELIHGAELYDNIAEMSASLSSASVAKEIFETPKDDIVGMIDAAGTAGAASLIVRLAAEFPGAKVGLVQVESS